MGLLDDVLLTVQDRQTIQSCELYGETVESTTHVIWSCPALHEQSVSTDKALAECRAEETLPQAVLRGIAPEMKAKPMGIFFRVSETTRGRWSRRNCLDMRSVTLTTI